MTAYFMGADIGGTKTHILVTDAAGNVVGFGETGPGNPETVGYDGLGRAFRQAVGEALAKAGISAGQISGLGLGVAGYDWPSQRSETLAVLDYPGLNAPREMVNDTILGLLAGSGSGWGIAVVSGTGCNCWGWDQQRQRQGRVTGGGTWMGEAAGATELIAQALQAVAHAWTLRAPQTQLGELFSQHVGAKNVEDLLEGLMSQKYDLRASAAPLVFQAAQTGDRVAGELIDWAGRELGEMVKAVIRQLDFAGMEFDVVMVGSMFSGGESLIAPMRRAIQAFAPGARLVRLQRPPVTGAVLLGMEAAGMAISAATRQALFSFIP